MSRRAEQGSVGSARHTSTAADATAMIDPDDETGAMIADEDGGSTMSERFWDEVAPFQASGRLDEGTMFGFKCVRAGRAFVAMPGHESDGMVVKLPADRVTELVEAGRGTVVAPSGRTFKEWVEISADEEWGPYLEEALAFATDQQ